jgi:hypothetical protein
MKTLLKDGSKLTAIACLDYSRPNTYTKEALVHKTSCGYADEEEDLSHEHREENIFECSPQFFYY